MNRIQPEQYTLTTGIIRYLNHVIAFFDERMVYIFVAIWTWGMRMFQTLISVVFGVLFSCMILSDKCPTRCNFGCVIRKTGLLTWRFVQHGLVFLTFLRLKNGRHLADDIFRCIFLNEKICVMIKNSLKFVPMDSVDNNPALAQMMAWRRIGDKPWSEPILTQSIDAYMRH